MLTTHDAVRRLIRERRSKVIDNPPPVDRVGRRPHPDGRLPTDAEGYVGPGSKHGDRRPIFNLGEAIRPRARLSFRDNSRRAK